MQKTSRKPPVIASNNVDANVMRLRRKSASILRNDTAPPEEVARLAALMDRVSSAVRQMKYFRLAATRFTHDELASSATRAGFILKAENAGLQEASFEWGAGAADLLFTASYRDPARASIIAQSQGDIFGLILIAYSDISTISVEINPTIEAGELGENALLFRDMILTFPGFEDVPAWTSYPEIAAPEAGGLLEMWRDGVSLASVVGRAWNPLADRLLTLWNALRNRNRS